MHKILKTRFVLLACICCILLIACSQKNVKLSPRDIDMGKIRFFSLSGSRDFFIAHVEAKKELEGKPFEPGESLGHIMPFPKTLSEKYNAEILKSNELYEQRDYKQAAVILKLPIELEPYNAFILEAYAKALYRQNLREESFVYYKRLIDLLNRGPKMNDKKMTENTIVIDFWFVDAYWKYGTLLMDRGEWKAAAFEISRFLLMNRNMCSQQPNLCVQAFSYLTEANFEMKEYNIARYYAEIALALDPSNGYVKSYLAKMPE